MTTKLLVRMAAAALVAAVIGGLPGAPVAHAAETGATERAQGLGDRARDAFQDGDFEAAIALYLQAYETARSAGFLYNIGFVYKTRLDDPELALQYFERVLDEPDADDRMRERTRAHIAELRARLADPPIGDEGGDEGDRPGDAQGDDPDAQGGDPDAQGDDPDGQGGDPDARPPDTGEPPAPSAPSASRGLAPWIVGGAGVAALGAGIAFAAVASATESDFHAATTPAAKRSLQSSGQAEAIVADVLMITGVAAIGAGVVLWLVGDEADERGSVHVAPAFIEGGAAVTFGGRL